MISMKEELITTISDDLRKLEQFKSNDEKDKKTCTDLIIQLKQLLQIIKEAEDIEPFKKTYNNLQFIIKYLLK
jgi:predicted transcriptional regulator